MKKILTEVQNVTANAHVLKKLFRLSFQARIQLQCSTAGVDSPGCDVHLRGCFWHVS